MENNIISSRIKELRLSLTLTQSEFAESIDTTQAALSGYERGDRTPSLDALINIAEKYNVSVDWLLGRSEKQRLSTDLETYTDLIKLLLTLYNAPQITQNFSEKEYLASNFLQTSYSTLLIEINDKYLVSFYEEWQEISSVRSKTPSGDKLYDIWLKDIYERFNFNLENASRTLDDIEETPFD